MEYSCNPKYIYECLKEQYKNEFEIIWAFAEPEKYQSCFNQNVILVKHFSIKSFYYLMTSKIVITSGSYVPWFPFRKKQTVINTWHGGGAYKTLDTGQKHLKKIIQKRNALAGRHTSVFVTSSSAFTKYVIQGAFAFHGKILETGMPRNDMLVRQDTRVAEQKVRNYFQLDDDIQIVLYAPTYRNGTEYEHLDVKQVVNVLQQQTNCRWICIARLHRYELGANKVGDDLGSDDCMRNASEYPDMQELLAAASILITDYSSSIWDYSFLNRPCFLYVPDLEEYRSNRGFYMDLEKWHFRYASTKDNMLQELKHLDKEEWIERMDQHHKDLKSCETGHAAKDVVQYIKEVCTDYGKI